LIVPAGAIPAGATEIARPAERLKAAFIQSQSEPEPVAASTVSYTRNYTWAESMKRVFALDVLECPRCFGRMRILAAIHSPDAARKILDCLGLPSRAPPLARALPATIQ
jgi:hypothetical protein